jgi:hypothetical protein
MPKEDRLLAMAVRRRLPNGVAFWAIGFVLAVILLA